MNYHALMLKTIRLTAWPLFVLMLLFIASGYALSSQYGLDRLIRAEAALRVHRLFDIPLVVLFLAHALPGIYFSLRRRGWISKRK